MNENIMQLWFWSYPEISLLWTIPTIITIHPQDVASSVELNMITLWRSPQPNLCIIKPKRGGRRRRNMYMTKLNSIKGLKSYLFPKKNTNRTLNHPHYHNLNRHPPTTHWLPKIINKTSQFTINLIIIFTINLITIFTK